MTPRLLTEPNAANYLGMCASSFRKVVRPSVKPAMVEGLAKVLSERRQQKPSGTYGDEKAHEGWRAQTDNQPGCMVEALRGADWWATEPEVCKLADGLPARLVRDMNRALGNAIVPQVAYQILRCIKAH